MGKVGRESGGKCCDFDHVVNMKHKTIQTHLFGKCMAMWKINENKGEVLTSKGTSNHGFDRNCAAILNRK